MRRERLRPAHDAATLAELYPRPHDHTRWRDHELRVAATIAIGGWLNGGQEYGTIADLSSGDGAIAKGIPAKNRLLGDLAPGYEITGFLEQTILGLGHVDLYVCCETLEHLDDPDTVLQRIRERADYLLLSTPASEFGSGNREHYWAWDTEAVAGMLREARFEPLVESVITMREFGVSYQIWGCR